MKPHVVAAALVLLSGCSWFRTKPVVAPVQASGYAAIEPVAAARAACPAYDAVAREVPFPRDAIIRGIGAGTAWVVFEVDGAKITVLSVTSSAPDFGTAAEDAVRTLRCTVERPSRFAIAFDWRRSR